MDYIILYIDALINLSNAMAIYILFGLIFAGFLHETVPDSIVTKHLGKDNIWSVVKSTLFGVPLPVCSCGVIPLASSIKKSGASNGATLSFLISTPITGVDSIMATYGIFGWIFTIYRVISSMIIAMVAGILTNILVKDKKEEVKVSPKFSLSNNNSFNSFTPLVKPSTTIKKKFSLVNALKYSFFTLLKDIAKPLFWGLILGAIIAVAIPKDLSYILKEHTWLSYVIVIVIAVPMYICATASLPIAGGLILSGVSLGAGFVFLSAGPATNTVTIAVVKKMLGVKSLIIYLGTIIIGSVSFGLMLDYFIDINNIDPLSLVNFSDDYGLVSKISSVILWVFVMWFMVKNSKISKLIIKG